MNILRRRLFQSTGWAAFFGQSAIGAPVSTRDPEESRKVYTRLGLRPIINAAGTYTTLGGSLMPPEVVQAMEDAARHYVPIKDLSRAVGARIAELTGNPGALVTTGAAGAIFVGTCACIAGGDPDKAKRLPFTDGMKNEVIAQKLHITGWTRQCEGAGARLIEVDHRDEIERAINGRTAMIYYLIADRHFGKHRDQPDAPGARVTLAECVEIAKKARIPLLVDAAAELPPHENLGGYSRMGVDLICFSGGKGLRGPQNAGLLAGRKDLIDIAETFQSPYSGIGRDLKVAKETYIGMLAAVERYVKQDHAAEYARWQAQADYMLSEIRKIPGVKADHVPKHITNHVPRIWFQWDEKALNFSREDCFKALDAGDPPVTPLRTPMGVTLVPWMMNPGEERVVARRVREVLEKAKATRAARPFRSEAELAADFGMDNPIDVWPGGTHQGLL